MLALARRVLPALESDGLVAYPTETVWGLAACGSSERAVRRLRDWKGRSEGQPISLLVEDADALPGLGIRCSPLADALIAAFWPGPLTLVLPTAQRFPTGIARFDGAVGVRCSSHPLAAALAQAAAANGLGPLSATSLNRSGGAPARTRREAALLCGAGPEAPELFEAGEDEALAGPPSTVVDLCGAEPRVLRWGALGRDALKAVHADLAVPHLSAAEGA